MGEPAHASDRRRGEIEEQSTAEPPLVGRGHALSRCLDVAEGRPGALVVWGERGVGRTRFAREAAAALAMDGVVVVQAEAAPGTAEERLARGLGAAGLDRDPRRATRLRPFVALLGDCDLERDAPGALAQQLSGTRALALFASRREQHGAAGFAIDRLAPEDGLELARSVAPGAREAAVAIAARLGDGLPGIIVPLAAAAPEWLGGDEPFPVPQRLLDACERRLERLSPWPLDLARWAAILDEAFEGRQLVRLSAHSEDAVERGIDELAAAGILTEIGGPGRPRFRFTLRLLGAALVAGMGPGERRRRHAAALAAGRAAGADAASLVRHAVGTRDPDEVVPLALRAAAAAREAGDAAAALEQADRALAWWSPELPEERRLAILLERGLALKVISDWEEAAAVLHEAAAGWAARGDEAGALAAASAEADALWKLGRRHDALAMLDLHLDDHGTEHPPTAARADALNEAAILAALASRCTEAVWLARRARIEAVGSGAAREAARSLFILGLAESSRAGGATGLPYLQRAREEAPEAGAPRTGTLAMISQSHVLTALGRPREAIRVARDGIAAAQELSVPEHELVLLGNLGEALVAGGSLREARESLERAAAGWAAIGHTLYVSPADPGLCWLDVTEGRLPQALERYHALLGYVTLEKTLFEQLAPLAAGHVLAAAWSGELDEARLIARGALSVWRSTDDRLVVVPLILGAIEAAERDEALALRKELAALVTADSPLARACLLLADARLARVEDRPRAEELYRTAAQRFEAAGMAWWAAWATLSAGEVGGKDAAAAEALLDARRRFREMEADGWRQRAEAGLRAIGRRFTAPRKVAGDELSKREIEVLELAAQGLSNQEIGERLFISGRTVGRHMERAFGKLGVSSRTAAVKASRERGLISGAPGLLEEG